MTVEMAVGLLAGSIPLTMLLLKFANLVKPVDFVRLATQCEMCREEMRRELKEIKHQIENLK
jgi:hypothetical protein